VVDRGKIALDDPVSKYIPSFAAMKVGVERKDATGKAVLDMVPPRRPVSCTTSSSSGCSTPVYDYSWPSFIKFAIVFTGTLPGSWALALALRKIPVVARMI
jgi:hypothetical protein